MANRIPISCVRRLTLEAHDSVQSDGGQQQRKAAQCGQDGALARPRAVCQSARFGGGDAGPARSLSSGAAGLGTVAAEMLDMDCVIPGYFVDGNVQGGGDPLALRRTGRELARDRKSVV